MKQYCSDIHNVTTSILLTWQPTWQLFTVLFVLSNLRVWAQRSSWVWLPNYVQRPWLVVNHASFLEMSRHQKVIRPGSWHKFIFPDLSCYFLLFDKHWKLSEKASIIYQRQPLHTGTLSNGTGSLHKVRFLMRKVRGGSLCKFTSVWIVDLSAPAMLASVTGFILFCFQRRECSSAVGGWIW